MTASLLSVPSGEAREAYVALLLLADESDEQVRSYMQSGDLLAWVDNGIVIGVVLAIPIESGIVEFKAVAVAEEHQGRGMGSAMLRAALEFLRETGVHRVRVGTGNSGIGQLAFYQKLGFRLTSIERDFFTPERGYPADLSEHGIPLRDMVWMDLAIS